MKESGYRNKDISAAIGLAEWWVSGPPQLPNFDEILGFRYLGSIVPQCHRCFAPFDCRSVGKPGGGAQTWSTAIRVHGEVSTRQRVNTLIERMFGVNYVPTQVGRILMKLGWSLQMPTKKALHRIAEATERPESQSVARKELLPAIKNPRMKIGSSFTSMRQPVICCLS
jgi:hypothetical protein